MSYRMRNILIAVALAGFAALLVTFYVSNYKKSVQHQQAAVTVRGLADRGSGGHRLHS